MDVKSELKKIIDLIKDVKKDNMDDNLSCQNDVVDRKLENINHVIDKLVLEITITEQKEESDETYDDAECLVDIEDDDCEEKMPIDELIYGTIDYLEQLLLKMQPKNNFLV